MQVSIFEFNGQINQRHKNSKTKTINYLYPPKRSPCHCGSRKRYGKCCYKEETQPFVALESDLTVVSDAKFLFLENNQDHFQLMEAMRDLSTPSKTHSLKSLTQLSERYPNHSVIEFLLALTYKLKQKMKAMQTLLGSSKNTYTFLPMNLLRWWHVIGWGGTIDNSSCIIENDLLKIAPQRKFFYLTEFCLWGLTQICTSINRGRFIRAEHHFLSMITMAHKLQDKTHWALKEAEECLERGYFLRRLKLSKCNP